jgi:molybdopterin converting factor small subunit
MSDAPEITVSVSSPLRDFCGGVGDLLLRAARLRDALAEIERAAPKLYRAICDESGRVRRHVNVYVNELHMSERDGLDTVLAHGDVVLLLPAVSGG